MENPNKVTIEITGKSIKIKIHSKDKVLVERSQTMLSQGHAEGDQKGYLEDDIPEFPDLAEAIEDLSMPNFGIAQVLWVYNEEEEY